MPIKTNKGNGFNFFNFFNFSNFRIKITFAPKTAQWLSNNYS